MLAIFTDDGTLHAVVNDPAVAAPFVHAPGFRVVLVTEGETV